MSFSGKYWRPTLNKAEWDLLHRHMEPEVNDSTHTIDEATKWLYANEKGTQVFAVYGIGDGTEATPLYAVGGKKAMNAYNIMLKSREEYIHGANRGAETLSRVFEKLRREFGKVNGGVSRSGRDTATTGHGRVSSEQWKGNGRRSDSSGVQNSEETKLKTSSDNKSSAEIKQDATQRDLARELDDAQKAMTAEELRAIQSIDNKSVNQFTSEDIRRVQRYAQQYWKEMGTKSPFFRAWFGDWRANDRTAVQTAKRKGSQRGLQRNADTGWEINISRKVFAETETKQSPTTIVAATYLPYI